MNIFTAIKRRMASDPPALIGVAGPFMEEADPGTTGNYWVLKPANGKVGRDSGSHFIGEPFELVVYSPISMVEARLIRGTLMHWLDDFDSWETFGVSVVGIVPQSTGQGQEVEHEFYASCEFECEVELARNQ